MESPSTSTRRFRFRDMENQTQSHTSPDFSSVSTDRDYDDDSELQSMPGHHASLFGANELKAASNEEFQRNIISNYSALVRVFEEVEGVENELVELKNHVLTQKKLVKELVDGINLEFLSEDTVESIIEEPACIDSPQPSELDAQINGVSETLDLLLSENKIDEALYIMDLEDENFQRLKFEGNTPSDVLMLYNSVICERKAMLTHQLTLVAENPRTAAPELQMALDGLCRLGDSHLATQLLLEYYHLRFATGVHDLWCSKTYLYGIYIRELAKLVFSMISQASRSFMMLHGEDFPYASELIIWACEETKVFVFCFNKYVKSISEINGRLSTVVEAVQFAMLFCSLLETQKLELWPHLIKNIRPCVEEVLQIHIEHHKKVIGIFTATDSWVLGRYLVSGIVNEGCSSMAVGQQPEYCLLTSSGPKFVTLLQAIIEDVSPLVALQMDGSILSGLMNLFVEYTIILERAITCEKIAAEKNGSRINLSESLPQQVSILVNLSTLEQFFSIIIEDIFGSISHINYEPVRSHLVGGQLEELDRCILFIQEDASQLRDCFCQKFIHRMMLLETGFTNNPETCIDDQHDLMPSVAFQVLFLKLRKLEKLADDGVIEVDWLMELLRELIEAIYVWVSNNKAIWATSEENFSAQHSENFKRFVLVMHFLEEIAMRGGYFSNNTLVLLTYMRSAFASAGLNPDRDVDEDGWAINVVSEAITKLLEIEKRIMPPNNNSIGIREEKLLENQSDYGSDSRQDDARSYLKNFMDSGDDGSSTSEVSVEAENMIMTTEYSPFGGFLDLREEEDGSFYGSAINSTDSSVEIEDNVSRKLANTVHGPQIIEKTDLPATLSFDIGGKYYKARAFIEEESSHQVNVAESVSNKLEDGGHFGVSGAVVATAEDSVEHEKEGISQTDSVLTNDCNNVQINAVNTLFKHEDINVGEIECMNGETEGHVGMDDGNVKQQVEQFSYIQHGHWVDKDSS